MNKVHLLNLDNAVAIFGSARLKEDHPHYKAAYELAHNLSSRGIDVLTGGGPGIMEAANKGAYEGSNGISVGFKIKLPFEDDPSVDQWQHITVKNDYFHFRQTALIDNASHYVAFCGGIGTEFEIYNVMTLMQCGFLPKQPIILYGKKQWKTFVDRMEFLVKEKTIDQEDLNLFYVTDDVLEIVDIINSKA